ncbi:MAG: tetratricopeptide repeat protein [Chromatiales bacterium]|nr:tetratricopeptide repeat protein [Chromatiales bacterium]
MNLALGNGNWPRAKTLLTQLSRRAPKDPQVWFLLGAVNGALGDPNGVVKATRKSLELKPDQPEALFNLANALHELGRSGEAMNPLRRLLAMQPGHARPRVLMGNAQDELGESMAAIASFSAAIETAPELVEAHANLAKVLAEQGEFPAARQAYANALRLRPDDDTVLYALVLPADRDARNRLRGYGRRSGNTSAGDGRLPRSALAPGDAGVPSQPPRGQHRQLRSGAPSALFRVDRSLAPLRRCAAALDRNSG